MATVVLKAKFGTQIEIDDCKELSASVSKCALAINDTALCLVMPTSKGPLKKVFGWIEVLSKMFCDDADRWPYTTPQERIRFLESIGATRYEQDGEVVYLVEPNAPTRVPQSDKS